MEDIKQTVGVITEEWMQAILQRRQQWQHSEIGTSNICPLCKGTGWEYYTKGGKEYSRDCSNGCRTKNIKNNKLEFAEIPEEFKNLTIESFKVDIYSNQNTREVALMVKTICKNYINDFQEIMKTGKGLYLYSRIKGSGKTLIAVSMANEIISKYMISTKFTSALRILDEIKSTYNSKENTITENQLITEIKKVPVLVIDDIGVEKSTAWVDEKFYSIIDARLISKKITIFTSNVKIEDLTLDERIKSRIGKMALPVQFPDESIRGYLARSENDKLLMRLIG